MAFWSDFIKSVGKILTETMLQGTVLRKTFNIVLIRHNNLYYLIKMYKYVKNFKFYLLFTFECYIFESILKNDQFKHRFVK